MLRPERHPLVTITLLAAYLAAGTASGLLHNHAHNAAACASATHADCHDHDHDEAQHDGAAVAGASHDEDCVVCRFLAQRVMPAEIEQLEAGHAPSFDLPLAYSAQPATSYPRTTHSRAPPQLG